MRAQSARTAAATSRPRRPWFLPNRRYQQFASLKLVQPFEQSLAEKQRRMDAAMDSLEALVDYEVAEVTAAATYYIAETYLEFSVSLMESERPAGLSDGEMVDYELVIEEEAYPFEERAIDVHEENFELLAGGIYNAWVQKSLDKLRAADAGPLCEKRDQRWLRRFHRLLRLPHAYRAAGSVARKFCRQLPASSRKCARTVSAPASSLRIVLIATICSNDPGPRRRPSSTSPMPPDFKAQSTS